MAVVAPQLLPPTALTYSYYHTVDFEGKMAFLYYSFFFPDECNELRF